MYTLHKELPVAFGQNLHQAYRRLTPPTFSLKKGDISHNEWIFLKSSHPSLNEKQEIDFWLSLAVAYLFL